MTVQLVSVTRTNDGQVIKVSVYAIRHIEPSGTGSRIWFISQIDPEPCDVIVNETPSAILTAANL